MLTFTSDRREGFVDLSSPRVQRLVAYCFYLTAALTWGITCELYFIETFDFNLSDHDF